MECYTLRNVSFSYPACRERTLDGVNLTVRQGDFLVLFGASGCGKSTLLRLLKTALSPHGALAGEITFSGRPLSETDVRTQARRIGFVSQSPDNQIVCDKVWHELAFGAESLGLSQTLIRARVAETAAFFGMEEWFYRDVRALSGGQKQLLTLAAVMVMDPEVLILDEPTSQLDPIAASAFVGMLAKLNRELGITVILAEHRLEEVLPYATETAVMEHGRILCQGAPGEIAGVLRHNAMLAALPASMQLWAALGEEGTPCPTSVKAGKAWLETYAQTQTAEECRRESPEFGEPVLTADEIWFRYERDGQDVLRGLSLSLRRGEWLALVGGNGAGKSTALKVLSGIRAAQRGDCVRKGKIGVLPQDPQGLFVKKTVAEDLETGWIDRKRNEEWERRLQTVCALCGISHLLERHPFDLSGGEMQRVALAKILLAEPDILLLDEPTKGMDAAFKRQFAAILCDLLGRGYAVLMVSHDVEFCAAHADTVGVFFDGAVTAVGTPGDIFARNHFYTTAVSRMAKNVLPAAVTVGDVLTAFGKVPEAASPHRAAPPPAAPASPPPDRREDKVPLSLPRKILAAFFALCSLGVFLYATAVTDLTKIVTSSGITRDGYTQFVVYGVFLLSLLGFILSTAQKSDGSMAVQTPKEKRKLSKRTAFACVLILLVIPLTLYIGVFYFGDRSYGVVSVLLLLFCMLPFFMIFEGRKPKPREIVVMAVLCGLGVAGRAAFFMLPQFKPVLALTILAGIAFGGEAGFMVGAVTMLVSNMLFSQGPWTPWQMFAMGIIGFLAGILFRKGLLRRTRLSICIFGALSAVVIYGGIMNPASVLIFTPASFGWKAVLASYLTGFPMDLIHAASTVVFAAFLAEPMLEKLDRIKTKYGLAE